MTSNSPSPSPKHTPKTKRPHTQEHAKSEALKQVEAEVRAALKPRDLPIRSLEERQELAHKAFEDLATAPPPVATTAILGQTVVTEDEIMKLRGQIPKIGTKHHIRLNPTHFRIKYYRSKFPDLRSEDLWVVKGYSTKRVNYVNERTGLQISIPKAEVLPLTIWQRF